MGSAEPFFVATPPKQAEIFGSPRVLKYEYFLWSSVVTVGAFRVSY